ncbi:MAG: type I methionyl aminopeptidase [Candidatus Eremiobacteraeota bacterium]|nr:type I methionyl aminopeptidase [Candidatus Eremiobacteraeota bacterium]MBC5826662.1 type I methionyl aminopeptidase [Candidatus Eremiobacteraeota bacterium]
MTTCRSAREIDCLRIAGRVTARALEALVKSVVPGATTGEIDAYAEELIRKQGGEPAFLGYHGFSGSICASVNDEVVHGIPGRRKLIAGDLLKIDIGARVDGWYGDMACTVAVGEISPQARRLVETTKESLLAGIAVVRPGAHVSDIGHAVQGVVERQGFSVVRALVGHGVGRQLHEEPPVPNYGKPGNGVVLKPGMVLAVEPMVNAGSWQVRTNPDGWTVVTAQGCLSAHFEHTIAVTALGCEILTVSSDATLAQSPAVAL